MMVVFYTQRLLGLFILINLTVAARFRFSIQEIDIGSVSCWKEDDVILAIASTTGFRTKNETWSLNSAEEYATIKRNNLLQEFEVPNNAANSSVAIAAANSPNADEKKV
jgi:hypothetical protein